MDKGLRWKLIICLTVSVFAIWLLIPTLWTINHPDQEKNLPGWLPQTNMKLGLDLRGGVHMVMGVDLDKVVREQLAIYGRSFEKSIKQSKNLDVTTRLVADKFELEIVAAGVADLDVIASEIRTQYDVLSIVGEADNVLVAKITIDQENYIRRNALDQSIETIRNRIDEFGVSEPIISRRGDSQILVQFPGEQEPERLKALIGQTAQLQFVMVHECRDAACLANQQADLDAKIRDVEAKGEYTRDSFARFSEYRERVNADLASVLPPNTSIAFERVGDLNVRDKVNYIPFLLSVNNSVSGEYIENAFVALGSDGFGPQMPYVAFEMNTVGTPMFGKLTTEYNKHYMAIVLDGTVKSAPIIQNPITGGSGRITLGSGNFEQVNQDARDLAIVLRAGALPASIESQEERVIGPSIGQDAIEAGKNALIIAAVLIFLFMWIYYGTAGFIGNLAIVVNIALIFGILGSVGATLTLPGIAGIVLTMGMAVDALIIIFERMREELRGGRSHRQVIHSGFEKALSTILDSNVTTAIGAVVLLNYGTGSIRGFALTLLVGILSNVFIATFFTKTLFELFYSDTSKLTVGLDKKDLQAVSV